MITQAFWIAFALFMGVGAAALISIAIFLWIVACAIGEAAEEFVKLFTNSAGQ